MSAIDETALAAATAAVTAEIARYWNDDTVEPGHGPVAEAAVRAYLAALVPQQAAPMPGVKALEWVKHPATEAWRADTDIGLYQVWAVRGISWEFAARVSDGGTAESVDAAKAAAQVHYNSRILSALATPEAGTSEPVAREVAWRWRDGDMRWQCTADEDRASYAFRVEGYEIEPLYTHPAPAQAPVDGEAVRALLSRLIYPVDTSINPHGWELREKPMIEEAVRYIQENLAAPSARKEP